MEQVKRRFKHKKYSLNPSYQEVGRQIFDAKEVIRTKNIRDGVFKGIETTISNMEVAKTLGDRRTFKIFYDSNESLHKFVELSISAQRILVYIITKKLEYNKSSFHLSNAELIKELELSKSATSIGLMELRLNGWIFDSDLPHKFWINVSYVTYGDSIEMYNKEYYNMVRKRKDEII